MQIEDGEKMADKIHACDHYSFSRSRIQPQRR